MYKIGEYKDSDSMSELICANYQMLLVLSRFGIALGFGDKSIKEVCSEHTVDIKTFLAVVNLLVSEEKEVRPIDLHELSVPSIIMYLRNSHTYFLEFRLPLIRCKLIEAIDCSEGNAVALVIVRYYDEYVSEVRKHMMYEENTVFSYVEGMLNGTFSDKYNIDIFSKHHDKVEAKLSELKNIIIKYYPAKTSDELTSVLFEIFSCAEDLASHNDIEDYLFVPSIREIESFKSRPR